ncbi:hypothetical protein [Moorena sp. SIO4A1]|nr:hypothetical protein [Moorena sp. SIO4A1]
MMGVYAIASARPNTNHLGYSNSYSLFPVPCSLKLLTYSSQIGKT